MDSPLPPHAQARAVFSQAAGTVLVRRHDGRWLLPKATFVERYGQYLPELLAAAALSTAVYDGEAAPAWRERLREAGYEPLPDPPALPREQMPGRIARGLHFSIWLQREQHRALVGFGGTKVWGDWWANLRPITRFIPRLHDHYEQVRRLSPLIEQRVVQALGEVGEIIATGHSLGGGLAQQLCYHSALTRRALVFAPSPVTGWFSTPREQRDRACRGAYIARISEKGEVLAFLRWPVRQLLSLRAADPRIEENRCNFLSGNMVREHSMGDFASALVKKLGDTVAA